MADIALTSAMRNNLVSLQLTDSLISRTQERLSTGKKVNSPIDNPANYFAAQGHTSRANKLTALKDGMSEAIQMTKAATSAVDGISKLIESARGIITQARQAADPTTLEAQYDDIMTQIDQLALDAGYKGVNFLDSDTLDVKVGEEANSTLTLTGFDASANAGLGISAADFSTSLLMDAAEVELDDALTTLQTESATLSANLGVLTVRQEFTTNMVNVLKTGADNLTLADMNEEAANMLALQTQQQLGVTALSLASQAAQSVLRLF